MNLSDFAFVFLLVSNFILAGQHSSLCRLSEELQHLFHNHGSRNSRAVTGDLCLSMIHCRQKW